jgi:antitoxin YefM
MSETRSLADVKAHLSEVVDLVVREDQRVYITKRGKPVAVIMSAEELEGLEDTLDIIATPGALEQIREAEAAIERGEYLTAAELRAKYLRGK